MVKELKQLGRYIVEEYIGSGAYADVYRAHDPILNRTVALKILKPSVSADAEIFARFSHEAKILANLTHPHIAWVWDVGEEAGSYFLVIRYIPGVSLDRLLAESGCLPWEKALQITLQIAEALKFAHTKGIIHRDVKPQNIIIDPEDGAVLTDFGLVKALGESSLSTQSGVVIGTPEYIPPEIWLDQPVSAAADQYALAAVLVEMLTGRRLFGGSTPPAVMAKHFQPVDLPSAWPAGAPNGLYRVLTKALAREPGERYPDIGKFAAALVKLKTSDELAEPKPAAALPEQETSPASPTELEEASSGLDTQQPTVKAERTASKATFAESSARKKTFLLWGAGITICILVITGISFAFAAWGDEPSTQAPSATWTATFTPKPSPTRQPTTARPIPSPTFTPTVTPSKTITATPTPNFTNTPTPSATPTLKPTSTKPPPTEFKGGGGGGGGPGPPPP